MKTNPREIIWPYIHGQLDRREAGELEKTLAGDPKLAAEVKHLRRLDGILRKLLPLAWRSEETLERDILTDWERSEQAGGATAVAESAQAPKPIPFYSAYRSSFRLVWAAAASLVLCTGLYLMHSRDPLAWSAPQVSGPAMRGADSAQVQAFYSEPQAIALCSEVEAAIDSSYLKIRSDAGGLPLFTVRRDWTLQTRFQDLRDGKFMLEVTAQGRANTTPETWSACYLNANEFKANVKGFSDTVAQELWKLK